MALNENFNMIEPVKFWLQTKMERVFIFLKKSSNFRVWQKKKRVREKGSILSVTNKKTKMAT